MDSASNRPTDGCHVVAMPFPGRGHINPMLNFCKLLASRRRDLLISVVVTEEWLGFIDSDPKPNNVRLASIPNVVPPERLKAVDFPGFYEAVMTKMETPVEQLLDRLEPPVAAIIGDIEVRWAIGVGNRRNIPVAAFWTMSPSFFSMFYSFGLFAQNRKHSPFDLLEQEKHIPGISSSEAKNLQKIFQRNDQRVLHLLMECISRVPNAQHLIFTSVHELESQIMNALKAAFSFPVYTIGPSIPYFDLKDTTSSNSSDPIEPDYIRWLNGQPPCSVLYVSLGSFLKVSNSQMDEIFAGLKYSGIRFLWVARGEASRLKESCGDNGLVIAWCDQLKVLCHSSVCGFWTHCGWNSTLEAVFSGVPMITFPLFLDQEPNSDLIVDEWEVGFRMKSDCVRKEIIVSREEITRAVRNLMDLESEEGKNIRARAKEVQGFVERAISECGSSMANLDAFVRDISARQYA